MENDYIKKTQKSNDNHFNYNNVKIAYAYRPGLEKKQRKIKLLTRTVEFRGIFFLLIKMNSIVVSIVICPINNVKVAFKWKT